MGRNRNLGNSNANSGNSEDGQNFVNNVKNCGNEDERNFDENNFGTEREVTKNFKKQHLLNAVQITSKKYVSEEEKQDEIKEVRRSRGRPRKIQVETEIRKNLKKSFCENDDLLKFENEVYENEETYNANMENSPSRDINLLNIDMSDSSETVKAANSVSPNFESEIKISTESIITISSEENSNSNPIVRALQSTPTSDRNLSSPDVLKVQFNPSSTKTYKNKRKFVNSLIDNNCIDNNISIAQSITETTLQKDVQNEKIKNPLTKSSANFEINPNFVRNTRKKVLKYDVCDLLNKKSHKKIQIEARIDSMPVKSKVNVAKTSDANIVGSNKTEISPTRVIPKINEMPSIIRKNVPHDIEYSAHDNSGNIFSSVIDSSPPPKSLIQIQGKIVADNRSICFNKENSQDSVEGLREFAFLEMDPKLLNNTCENNILARKTAIKRKPGRPKIKKDNILPSQETKSFSKNLQTIAIESNSEIMNEKYDKCKTENIVLVDKNPDNLIQTSGLTKCSQIENLEIITKSILLSEPELIEPKKCEVTSENKVPHIAVTSKIGYYCSNVSFKNEISEEKKTELVVNTTCSEQIEFSNENKNENGGSNATLISTQMTSDIDKINLIENFIPNEKYKSNCLESNPTETQVLSIKNIKDVRVLIKGSDNIKLKKQEKCSDSFENFYCSEKLVQEVGISSKDNTDSTNSLEKLLLNESVIDIKNTEKILKQISIEEHTEKNEKEKNISDIAKKSLNIDEHKFTEIQNIENKEIETKINTMPLFFDKTIDSLSETDVDSVNILQEAIIDKNLTEEVLGCEESSNSKIYETKTKNNNIDIEVKLNKSNITEEISATVSAIYEESVDETIDQMLFNLHEDIKLPDKNKEVSFSLLETSQINDVSQQIKPKELKTGMDIWLEKVQLETKLKNLHDSTKKLKSEVFQKTKSKEEFKIKNDGKRKSDMNSKLELHKNDNKNKQYSISKDEIKYLNYSKPRKDYKEKLENKSKLIASKYDAKYKEIKSEKKLKDEVKVKSDFKAETKVKTESFPSKQNFKTEKEEIKLKNDKSNKIDLYNQTGKNETSLKTIDIFNFAAKDEIVQKGYSKKKTKKNDLNMPYQEKIQFIKTDIADTKNDVDKDPNLKKINTLEKSPKTSKDKKLDKNYFEKNEDFDKNIDNETKNTDLYNEYDTKFKKRNKDLEEEINRSLKVDSNLNLSENELAYSIAKLPEPINVTKTSKENPRIENLVEICGTQLNPLILEENANNKLITNERLNLKSANEIFPDFPHDVCNSLSEVKEENTTSNALVTKETKIEDVGKDVLKPELETNESTNEVLDPLKDIESFLEAAGNLLSRSHSSDDEKDPLGRRSIRNRNSAQSDDKISFEHFEEENDLSAIKKDENLILEHSGKTQEVKENLVIEKECIDKIHLKTISNLINKEKIKKHELFTEKDLVIPTKLMQRENREEWFSQIDSSIDKDLNDEVSFEQNRKLNESLSLPKKTGTGPRTPPLPPPLSDEEIEKGKIEDNVVSSNNMYERENLEKEIANSIISTSIKIPMSMATSLHELKFMGSPKNQNDVLDEQLKLIENQINKKSKKKSEASQKDKELKKFLKTLKKNELSGDWKKTYKELKKIKKKSAEGFAVSKSSLKYLPENENISSNEETLNLNVNQKNKKNSDFQDEYNNNNLTIRRSHRLKSIALQQQNQQMAIGRGGLVRNDYEDLIRADLSQVQEQNTKFLKAMENSLNQFKQVKENEYKCERVVSKEAKRMVCDCFLTREEEERGEYGCGEDCLNRLLMIECGPKCNVGDRCTNKRFQRGQYAPCRVFMTEKKGCGIFAEVEIPAGEFIMEYVGEVVDSDQFEKRAAEYSACKNKHFYFMSLRSNAIIDATARGNISRFINHSCDPNAETQKWTVNGELHIGFFTTRAISSGEEITFDYQFQRYGKQAQKCYCEAAICRGWIGEEPDSDEEIEEEIELNFKDKEELEKISRDIQSYPGSEKMKKPDENMDDTQKLLTRKEIAVDIDKNKSILSDEELKIKQQEREQRKKDKLRKREIRLAQQKHDFLEDPDLEDEIYRLSKSGLKNQVQTLRLSRLIVRSKLLQTRLNLLEILRAGEIPCRRLFLDYHGLKLLHGWMNESESKDSTPTDDNLKMRLAILETLNCLPIPNKTMLKESKVYQIVHNWTQDKVITTSPTDDFASDSNSGHAVTVKDKSADTIFDLNAKESLTDIKKLAIKLINDWEVLPEVFRIPRKERVEQMKEHEREADRRCAGLHVIEDGRESKTTRDRYKKSRWDNCTKQRWTKSDIKERRKVDQEKLDDGLTKEQRRQAFAAKVAQDEAEKLNAEKRRNLEFEARREFEFKCKFFLLDCTKTHPRDIPFCVDQKTNTWYTLDKRKIPTPPSHVHIKMPPKTKSTNIADYKMPQLDLPPGWKYAIEPINGRIYYYHVKIRRSQWEPPPKIYPLATPENNVNNIASASNAIASTNDDNSSDSSESDCESNDESDATSLLVQERAISPRKEEDRVYNQHEMRRYKENKEKIRRRKEEIKRRKARVILKTGEQASEDSSTFSINESGQLPIADYLISSEEDDDVIVEELDSKLIERIVKGESIVDELDALKNKKPLKRPLLIKEKPNGNGSNSSNSNTTASDFKKRPKLEDKKHKINEELKKTKSTSKNSKYYNRRAKEKFRSDIAGIIVHHLQPYRKESCHIGKITTNEDFKHLARKLTHFVMIKELKHCDLTGQTLIVTDSVKNKSREFIKKYMAKYGKIYVRPETDPEYKEIPL